jgi:hypothetical protein
MRRRTGYHRLGQPVWSGCGSVACETICSAGGHPARPVPGSSGRAGTETVYGRPFLRVLGAGGRVLPEMLTGGALARS